MSTKKRVVSTTAPATIIAIWAGAAVFTLAAITWIALIAGSTIEQVNPDLSRDPGEFLIAIKLLGTGRAAWPLTATIILLLLLAGLGTAGWNGWRWWTRAGSKRTRIDPAGKHLGKGDDVSSITLPAVQTKAAELGISTELPPGFTIGVSIYGIPLLGSWEDTRIVFAGPRTGKTTCMAIPAVLDAPGACVTTSNKRDLLDATRDVRAAGGRPVWVFDPQGVANEPATWWWNPLTYILAGRQTRTMDERAAKLAAHFASGSRDPGAKGDAHFDGAGERLLANLLLAAALAGKPITTVYAWVSIETDPAPVNALRDHGFRLRANAVEGLQAKDGKYRGSVYATAIEMAACLAIDRIAEWITPGDTDRPEFVPTDFVTGTGTLYALSREGGGSAGPLTTALTAIVCDAAEEYATRCGGRVPVPFMAVLDEAANVCAWRDLPKLYSHYGSRGIILDTYLQSWSQAVGVWGDAGAKALKSAANIVSYGGGIDETDFLGDLVKLVGTHWTEKRSVSASRQGRTVSTHTEKEDIFEVADLAAWPKGRGLIFSSGNRVTIARLLPWMAGPHAEQVRASINTHDPRATSRLAQLAKDAEEFIAAADDPFPDLPTTDPTERLATRGAA